MTEGLSHAFQWNLAQMISSLAVHVVLALLLIKLTLLLCRCILVLLVLRDKIVHVRLCFCELHLIHALTRVPMQECLAAEHSSEVFSHALEHLLNCRGVAQERHRHLQSLWWDVADANLDVVRDPLDKVRRVLVLHVEHLFINFLSGHPPAKQGCRSQVTAMTWISRAHHVFGVEHLLRELWHCERAVLLGAAGRQRRKANHEEVQAWEWNQVHRKLPEVSIQLTREAKARRYSADCSTHKMVQISIGRCRQLQSPEADVVERLLSRSIHSSAFSTSWWKESTAL